MTCLRLVYCQKRGKVDKKDASKDIFPEKTTYSLALNKLWKGRKNSHYFNKNFSRYFVIPFHVISKKKKKINGKALKKINFLKRNEKLFSHSAQRRQTNDWCLMGAEERVWKNGAHSRQRWFMENERESTWEMKGFIMGKIPEFSGCGFQGPRDQSFFFHFPMWVFSQKSFSSSMIEVFIAIVDFSLLSNNIHVCILTT